MMSVVQDAESFPALRQVVLDTTDARALAEFYRRLLGFTYRPGDEPPPAGGADPRGRDWLVLRSPAGGAHLAFQQVDDLPASTWPEPGVAQQAHLALGARLLSERADDADEPLRVYADPDGHPFCVFVAR
jgi:hypothetical protein